MDIKKLPDSEKPRERLMRFGPSHLSDAELLAVVLGNGTKQIPVMELAECIISADRDGSLTLSDCEPEELIRISGIGKAGACRISAALELGKRISSEHGDEKYIISSPDKAAFLVMDRLRYLKREIFLVIMLNTKGEAIALEKIAEGSLNAASVRSREVFSTAVKKNAFAVILVHNHPSGDPTPSKADIETTKRLVSAGNIIGIPVTDHIVIGNGRYYSFKENKIV